MICNIQLGCDVKGLGRTHARRDLAKCSRSLSPWLEWHVVLPQSGDDDIEAHRPWVCQLVVGGSQMTGIGTFRTQRDVRLESVVRSKADIAQSNTADCSRR